jgi:hypothetical protein
MEEWLRAIFNFSEKLNEHFAQLSLWGASGKLPLSLEGARAQRNGIPQL